MPVFVDTGEKKSAKMALGVGIRRTSPESIRAKKQSQDYRKEGAPRPSRTAALKTLKRAAPALGIGPVKLALIDQLFAFSKPADWTGDGGIGPMVWPSNAHLARSMNLSTSTLCYHLRGLAALGLISYLDSPTCRRHGKRDEDGRIVEACGIDLSPIAMRIDELSALAQAHEDEAREMNHLCRRRTVLHKAIRSLITSAMERGLDEGTDGSFSHAQARLDVIQERRPKDMDGVIGQVEDLEALQDRLEALYDGACGECDTRLDVSKIRHRGIKISIPHTTTASTFNSESCSSGGIAQAGDNLSIEAACGSMAYEDKPDADFEDNKQSEVEDGPSVASAKEQPSVAKATTEPAGMPDNKRDDSAPGTAGQPQPAQGAALGAASMGAAGHLATQGAAPGDDDAPQLSIALVRAACPAIEGAAPGALADWKALRDSGQALCAGADINPQVFREASDALGPDIAIAAAAVTVQKAAQGDVFNPGAYLRTLTKRGKAGELRIARSLHGLAGRNGAEKAGAEPAPNAARAEKGACDDPQTASSHCDAGIAPTTRPAFPAGGSIRYTMWADTVRQLAPAPIPDVDRVAQAFRCFCRRNGIDMTSPNIATVFATFCRKWKERE